MDREITLNVHPMNSSPRLRRVGASVILSAAAAVAAIAEVHVENYGTLSDGRGVKSFTLTNSHGLRAVVLEYGAILASVETPDRDGKLADITLGHDTLAGWEGGTSYFGAPVGRYANRIAAGKFSVDGETYTLATNNVPKGVPCHLHGGNVGFNKRIWAGRAIKRDGADAVEFVYVSPDGEEGYPGTLTTTITYVLSEQNELTVEFRATTDGATIVNLAHHVYWNLSGDPTRPITDHVLTLAADQIVPVDRGLIPTGELAAVKDTPFDFTSPKTVGERIEADHEQLKFGRGYDHCWVLREPDASKVAATVFEPKSGRVLEVFTDQPGVQFYSGNFLDGSEAGKKGVRYQFRTGLCLETQKFPDSPNRPEFPSTVLHPGEVYRHTVRWRFSTR